MPIGVAGEFQDNGVGTDGKFECGGSVAMEFVVDEDFRAVWFGRNGNGSEGLR